MPLGWYLAQGLCPLGPSSSDDEEGPCELPDGRYVCGPHGLVLCHKCCTDYTMDNSSVKSESSGDRDESDRLPAEKRGKRRGTGQVFPTKFIPPTNTAHPMELFHGWLAYTKPTRFIQHDDTQSILIFTDGACLNNGQLDPKAGWAFVHGQGLTGKPKIASGRLEIKGPFGDDAKQTSNRAELRAVIAALRFRHWTKEAYQLGAEGFRTITIATDSEYVVEGSTEWAKTWATNGWKTSGGEDVENKDMWEMLLGEVERWKDEGLSIRFWRIPRRWNNIADAAAKDAASADEVQSEWIDV